MLYDLFSYGLYPPYLKNIYKAWKQKKELVKDESLVYARHVSDLASPSTVPSAWIVLPSFIYKANSFSFSRLSFKGHFFSEAFHITPYLKFQDTLSLVLLLGTYYYNILYNMLNYLGERFHRRKETWKRRDKFWNI